MKNIFFKRSKDRNKNFYRLLTTIDLSNELKKLFLLDTPPYFQVKISDKLYKIKITVNPSQNYY